MDLRQTILGGSAIVAAALVAPARAEDAGGPYVRIADIEIDPAQFERFSAAVKEEIEESVRVEPGVVALNAVALADDPTQVRVLEVYTDRAAYAAHLEAPHFKKFKDATQRMVRSLKLHDGLPIALADKPR